MSTSQVSIASHRELPIEAEHVRALFAAEEWWPERSLQDIQAVIDAGPAVGAWRDGRLVGFVRAVSDDQFRAYVEECVVEAPLRRSGLATELLAALLRELSDIDVVSLFCAPGLVPVYERSGFTATSQVVMHRAKDANA